VVIPTAHPEGAFHVGRVGEMFDHADHVICLAPEEADLVRRTYPAADEISVVPCPVEPVTHPGSADIDRAVRGLGVTDPAYAVVVGRVDPAKGSDDVIRFASAYRRSVDPTFELVVIGPGGEGVEVPGVSSTGFVDEGTKTALVAGAGLLVQPSYMESFSLALIEAWLLGRPTLVQGRSRVLEGHVRRSGGGLSYTDYLSFEAALATIRSRPAVAAALAARGRRYSEREFAWGRVAPAFLDALALASSAGGRRLARSARVVR
jgi:glycosyltransferase involved in cell wall biosynthesis